MPIYFLRAEGVPLEQLRGLETIDRNILFVLVQASVELVAQAFSTLRQMNVWVRDAYERAIDIHNESTFVFQLRGHSWSIVFKLYVRSMRIDLTEEDACRISESLGTAAIYYAGSDTCGTLEYQLYQNGVLQEKLFFEEEVSLEFQSQLRSLEAKDIRDAYTFTMNFIREQDAYIPNIVQREDLRAGQRTTLSFENLMPHEVERMDYLAQQ
ncbi:hypothetical protein [Chroogloeocystis siderophila]|jgi:hypothetical protein|uniref:Uncharacterized protein n=1 Tax=Chroogloeocystis siderophila 5.2 s.c.1 TaxID=247279 RepID=A0A1U7HQE4_9CHRO|nr:hypothetical protein [Chroogloeocystis siderophila]OKH25745.1 hypothetical protein NIES1031_12075 [Chroogloeocystis siderophila 5.2 s.c.1]